MEYIDGFLAAVPNDKKAEYIQFVKEAAAVFKPVLLGERVSPAVVRRLRMSFSVWISASSAVRCPD